MNMPTLFSIETVLGCNLQCLECAVGSGLVTRKYGSMSFERYMVIHNKIKDYAKYIYLHIWGEPLINKDILPIMRTASQVSRINISTNANMITEKYASDIIATGVQDIIVSIDGMTQRTYGLYRRKGDIKKAMQGLKYLVIEKKKQCSPVNISPQFIVFEHNKHEMPLFDKFCLDLGTFPIFKAPYIRKNSYLKNSGISYLTRSQGKTEIERRHNMCSCSIENEITILLDGSVVACCYDHNGQISFGNIFEQTLEEIVAGKQRRDYCSKIALGEAPDFCMKNCLLY